MARNIKKEVKMILENNPDLREEPNKLIAYMWGMEVRERNILTITDLLNSLVNKGLTNPETIRRSRRKVVEEYPELGPSSEQQSINNIYEQILRRNRGEF